MNMQLLVVSLLVVVSFVYAAWALMPQVARRWLARQLLQLPCPTALRRHIERILSRPRGCACDSCEVKSTPDAPARAQTVRFYPRQPKP